jgi:hypothetical protein
VLAAWFRTGNDINNAAFFYGRRLLFAFCTFFTPGVFLHPGQHYLVFFGALRRMQRPPLFHSAAHTFHSNRA